jgi:sulfur relay protein TusB/DsrH
MMSVLFVISESQDSPTALKIAERMARRGQKVSILFIREACRHLTDPEFSNLIFFAGVYCLGSDLDQIELEKLVGGVRLVDYSGWVELVEANEKIVSWT